MTEREELITEIKRLYEAHKAKAPKNNPPEVGYLTRELCKIASLEPRMRELGIMPEDLA